MRNHDTLVPIGATAVYPLPLYSVKHTSVADIPAGGQVVIPNDPTNQARALLVLQAAKLVAQPSIVIDPDPAAHEQYLELLSDYREATELPTPLMHRLAARQLKGGSRAF